MDPESQEEVPKSGKILLFHEDSLQKCRAMLNERKKQNIKYSTVALPDEVDKTHGYHLGCYRRFMALSQKQREKMIESSKQDNTVAAENSKIRTRSSITAPKPTSNTGIFPTV